jgi:hypothetical protein
METGSTGTTGHIGSGIGSIPSDRLVVTHDPMVAARLAAAGVYLWIKPDE